MVPVTIRRMAILVALSLCGGLFPPCPVCPALAADRPEVEREIRNLLDRVSECYKKRDVRGLMTFFAPVPDLVTLGANPANSAVGHAETGAVFQRYFDQVKRVDRCYCRPYGIATAGDVAWFAGDLSMSIDFGAGLVSVDGRYTAVVRKIKGRWLFVQSHFSLPAARPAPARR